MALRPLPLSLKNHLRRASNLDKNPLTISGLSCERQPSKGIFMGNLQGQPRITPFLWFNSNAEEAANFYVSVFDNSRILNIVRGPIDIVAPKGTVMVVSFELDGQTFTALNGGPAFHFTEAISFVVHCENQQQIDRFWSALTADGGAEVQCGWLKDKFGLSWQVVPTTIQNYASNPKSMQAMMGMKKLDIAELERAARS
jgi:predicted 3-demethylubiquinone-9 3-methyltransferase (glyoxalase superfamily)